jgi:large subunit ribosomal protein L19
MNQKLVEFNKQMRIKKVPEIKVGDIVRVHKRIKEGDKERVQVFKGLVIAVKGKQSSSPTITVRRESQKVGVEATFPIHLPTIEKIDVLRHSKVRRSKLYYMRERSGRAAKMKAIDLSEEEVALMKEIDKKPAKEEKTADKKTQKAEKKDVAEEKEEKKEKKEGEKK